MGLLLFAVLVFLLIVVFRAYSKLLNDYRRLKDARLIQEIVTDGKSTYDVEFTEKGIFVYRHDDSNRIILADINLSSAASALIDVFLDDSP